MSLNLSPPPLQIPSEFGVDKVKNAFFGGLINTIYQLWTKVYNMGADYKLLTTDATVTALVQLPIDSGKTIMVDAYIVSRRTGGSAGTDGDSAFYVLTGAYKNIGGVLTGIGSVIKNGGEDQAGWDVNLSSSGQKVLVTVTGAANNDITWEGTVRTYEVGA
jgi:hypothetical protein